ncbi:hypothetical protein GRS48_05370 [Halorubrum sp. JWXQ-INN 858]|uniref:DUF5796 family protein n=1 Tax=Halorubrum sp. JWXQ-INN 858 TaxID=2690782 RepID=UPI00135AC3C1|nr:DUF5796 family protein [Halorubrum sp. JWXQ-INN 858]MWV64255.1 hypothetical protein [Halorubrum sp. JWXQ-INN 858]
MSAHARGDVPPTSIGIELREEGVVVEYLDGRTTLYHGVPDAVEGALTTGPGKETHVLVTDPTGTEGVMTYVNDLKTDEEILRDSGVGRVVLESGDREELFPGVVVTRTGQRSEVIADPEVAGGRVFVFVEDEWTEGSFEIVAAPEDGLDGDR